MVNSDSTGSLGIKYAKGRTSKMSLRYRLRRRTEMVLSAISQHSLCSPEYIIDLGCADGRMLHEISQHYSKTRYTGVEYSQELVDLSKQMFPDIEFIQGDAQSLDIDDNCFDVVIATAVIEHVPDPYKMMCEIQRILKSNGIAVLTSPVPFWEALASKLGCLEKGKHYKVMNLKELSSLAVQTGLKLVESQKFMLSPVGMPFEITAEKLFHFLHLDMFMANQLLVARK